MKSMFATVLFAGVITATPALAVVYQVYPDGRGATPTIQSAIDSAAVSGDVILVHAGVYQEENILADGKEIQLLGHDGVPLLLPAFSGQGTGITLRNVGAGFTLMGFDIRGFETGIVADNASATVSYCNLYDCATGLEIGGALSAPTALFCVVDSCATGVSVSGGSAVTVRNMTIAKCGVGIAVSGGSVSISRNIIYRADIGVACGGGSALLSCNDFYLNAVDYGGCAPGTGDIHEMPRFCYAASGLPQPYLLHYDSPCWGRNNDCGLDMGAFIQFHGCEGMSLEETSWGAVKRLYR